MSCTPRASTPAITTDATNGRTAYMVNSCRYSERLRECADIDRFVVHEPVALRRDPKLVQERRHVTDVSAARRPNVLVHDKDLLRGLHERPRRLHLTRQQGEVLRLQAERRRATAHRLEGVVHLDKPTFLIVEERHPSHFRCHLSSPPVSACSGSRARPPRCRCRDRVPSPRARPLPRASLPRRARTPCGIPARGRRTRWESRSPRT